MPSEEDGLKLEKLGVGSFPRSHKDSGVGVGVEPGSRILSSPVCLCLDRVGGKEVWLGHPGLCTCGQVSLGLRQVAGGTRLRWDGSADDASLPRGVDVVLR